MVVCATIDGIGGKIMKKQLEIQMDTYTFAVAVESGNKAFIYFDRNINETESLKITFVNGFLETKFLKNQFGAIERWYKANDKWKGKQIKIALVDKRPMALISSETNEICLLTSPIFTKEFSFCVSGGNLLYLQEEYGVTPTEFYQRIQEELTKENRKIYQKKRDYKK